MTWAQPAAHLEALLAGVTQISRPGAPGGLVVYGELAFPVIVGPMSATGSVEPIAAAAPLGAGRLFALSHDGYLSTDSNHAGTTTFLANAARWAGNKSAPRIGVIGINSLAARWQAMGFVAANTTFAGLAGFDVICVTPSTASRADIATLHAYIQAGGGVLAAFTGWGWAFLNPTRNLVEDFPGNWLANVAGIAWSASVSAAPPGNLYSVTPQPSASTHAARALDALDASLRGGTFSAVETAIIAHTLKVAIQSLPAEDSLWRPRLNTTLQSTPAQKLPTPQTPIEPSDLLPRTKVTADFHQMQRLPTDQVTAHPAAASFPGSVPPTAARVTRSILIRAAQPRWQSTGLYAAPGEIVTVRMPASGLRRNFSLRIGAHTDRLWDVGRWPRFPEISRSFPLTQPETRVASAFGGLIYLERALADTGGDFEVEIAGAVAAPRYTRGRTTLAEWRNSLRSQAAPWGEIEGHNMIVTVPSSVLAPLDDPDAVAAAWDAVLDTASDLAVIARSRTSPERFVCDEEISAGYMHAGYPLMSHMDVRSKLVDVAFVLSPLTQASIQRQGDQNWGFFHEVGHNHQSPDWTFDGTTEVTVNLFTLYAFESVVRQPITENAYASAAARQQKMRTYNFAQPNFEQWKADPFLGLVMYVQLQQAFGWDAYKDVFAQYRQLSPAERPQNDQAKRDQWMVRFARRAGRNLGPFFQRWGVPVTGAALASIADLPPWMPDEMPPGNTIAVTAPPTSREVRATESATFSISATAADTTYQWFKDGRPIAGATTASHAVPTASASDAGIYQVVVTSRGRTTSVSATLRVVEGSVVSSVEPTNMSTLASIAGSPGLSPGFVLEGAGSTRVLIRAAGPALAAPPFGLPDTLPRPRLTVFNNATQAMLAVNAGWNTEPSAVSALREAMNAAGAFPFPERSDDAAVLLTLGAGQYSVQVSDVNGRSGTAIVEIYLLPRAVGTTIVPVNLSTLASLVAGGEIRPGFVLGGAGSKRVLVRAVGPTLAAFGVASPLPRPRLVIYNNTTQRAIAANTGWTSEGQDVEALTRAMAASGAFALPLGSADSAALLTLSPGQYSAIVSDLGAAAGTVIVEVYLVQEP